MNPKMPLCVSVQIMVVKLGMITLVFVNGCNSEIELETDYCQTEGDDSILEQLGPAGQLQQGASCWHQQSLVAGQAQDQGEHTSYTEFIKIW